MKAGGQALCVTITHDYETDNGPFMIGVVYNIKGLEKLRHKGKRPTKVDAILVEGCSYWLPQADFISYPDLIDEKN